MRCKWHAQTISTGLKTHYKRLIDYLSLCCGITDADFLAGVHIAIFMCCSCVIQMYRHWRNWVWVYWVAWKRWWRNRSAGGKLQRPTSSCSETLPSRSGFAPNTWSTITLRKQWKVLTLALTPIWQAIVSSLLFFRNNDLFYLLACHKFSFFSWRSFCRFFF